MSRAEITRNITRKRREKRLERGREKAWYIISENAEKAGGKKVEVIENLFYQLN